MMRRADYHGYINRSIVLATALNGDKELFAVGVT